MCGVCGCVHLWRAVAGGLLPGALSSRCLLPCLISSSQQHCSLNEFEGALLGFLKVLSFEQFPSSLPPLLSGQCSLNEFEDALGFFKVPQPAPTPQHMLGDGPTTSSGSGGAGGATGVQQMAQRSLKSFSSGQSVDGEGWWAVSRRRGGIGWRAALRWWLPLLLKGRRQVAPGQPCAPHLSHSARPSPPLPLRTTGATWVKASVGGMLNSLKPGSPGAQRGGGSGPGSPGGADGAGATSAPGFSGRVEHSVGSGSGPPGAASVLDDRQGQPVKVQVGAAAGQWRSGAGSHDGACCTASASSTSQPAPVMHLLC